MLKSALAFWAAIGAALLVSVAALGQPSPDLARCINEGGEFSPDAAFAGCSNVIRSGRETRPNLAVAYARRGNAYHDKGEYDGAIADYTKAIEIDPRHASAYHNRGVAYRTKGDGERAIADHAKAGEINPKYADVALVDPAKAPLSPALTETAALPPRDAPSPKITLVLKADLGAQQLTVLENDAVVHVWPISSRVKGFATPTGTFRPQWATRMSYSRQYNWTPMPYAVFFIRGVAFRGTNVTSRLGRSASHGCVRLATINAARLFHLVHKHGFCANPDHRVRHSKT